MMSAGHGLIESTKVLPAFFVREGKTDDEGCGEETEKDEWKTRGIQASDCGYRDDCGVDCGSGGAFVSIGE